MSDRDGFTPLEEAFFRAGAAAEAEPEAAGTTTGTTIETFADLDDGVRRRPLLRRLFSRKPTQQ